MNFWRYGSVTSTFWCRYMMLDDTFFVQYSLNPNTHSVILFTRSSNVGNEHSGKCLQIHYIASLAVRTCLNMCRGTYCMRFELIWYHLQLWSLYLNVNDMSKVATHSIGIYLAANIRNKIKYAILIILLASRMPPFAFVVACYCFTCKSNEI